MTYVILPRIILFGISWWSIHAHVPMHFSPRKIRSFNS